MTLAERLAAVARRAPVRDRSQVAVAIAPVGRAGRSSRRTPTRTLILASTTKLFTTAAALDRLGPGYRFRTTLLQDGELCADGTLAGRLVIRGGGDPAISGRLYENDPWAVFRPWSAALAARGIRSIRDGLLLDTSFFDDERTHPDWPAAQEQHWWQAPVSALSYNDNVVLVRVTGAIRPGREGQPRVLPGPAVPDVARRPGRDASRAAARTWACRGARGARGSSPPGPSARAGPGRATSPSSTRRSTSPRLSRRSSGRRGSRWTAPPEVRTQAPPPGSRSRSSTSTRRRSSRSLAVCNKRSQSFFAEQILKTLGAERRGSGSWKGGLAEVERVPPVARARPVPLPASPTARAARARTARAPSAYLDFLQALATRWRHFQEFEPTLAVTGDMDGSLRHRMLGPDTRGKVFAKTGNVAGVVTLAGYVEARSGQRYAFVLLANGGCSEGRGHAWQDRILTELARWG